jgi:hypothetical protein
VARFGLEACPCIRALHQVTYSVAAKGTFTPTSEAGSYRCSLEATMRSVQVSSQHVVRRVRALSQSWGSVAIRDTLHETVPSRELTARRTAGHKARRH